MNREADRAFAVLATGNRVERGGGAYVGLVESLCAVQNGFPKYAHVPRSMDTYKTRLSLPTLTRTSTRWLLLQASLNL